MRRLIAAALVVFCGAVPASADPKSDALAVLAQWSKAFAASDVDAIVSLYASDALFMGTGSKTVVTRTEDIRKYFEEALMTRRPRGATIQSQEVMVLSDTDVLVAALNDSTGFRDGKQFVNPGRVTFVISKRGPDWKIVHFHRSAMPK